VGSSASFERRVELSCRGIPLDAHGRPGAPTDVRATPLRAQTSNAELHPKGRGRSDDDCFSVRSEVRVWQAERGWSCAGVYFTAINVHNPTERDVVFRKKVAIAGRREQLGPVSEYFDARLGRDQALEIDCQDIREHAPSREGFLKGFVVIESDIDLDVVGVYTAAGDDGQVRALDVERVRPRGM
jgi:hypothetical protein